MLLDRVYTPALENVPEYFEHAARVMLDGMWTVNPTVNPDAMIFMVRHLADVPGYVYTEQERHHFQNRLRERLGDKPEETGKTLWNNINNQRSQIRYFGTIITTVNTTP
ncbi:hypothetical protein ACJJTC_005799 [Scirpophaga incertulas]